MLSCKLFIKFLIYKAVYLPSMIFLFKLCFCLLYWSR